MLSIGFIINVFVALALIALLWWGGNAILKSAEAPPFAVTLFTVFVVVVAVIYCLALLTRSAPVLYRG